MFLKILDISRIVIVTLAFYFGYQIGFAEEVYNAKAQLHIMIPLIIFAIAGTSGFEGIFFAKESAKLKGFEVDSNYQKQSAIALLSYAFVAVWVYFANWGIMAELTVLFTFLFFLVFSGTNHALEAIKKKNYKWQNINRPFITFILILGLIYPLVMVFRGV